MSQTYASPVNATVERSEKAETSMGDSLAALGGLLLSIGSGVLVGAFYGPLAGVGASLVIAGALMFLSGVVLSWRGR